jgi:hypothetical protein
MQQTVELLTAREMYAADGSYVKHCHKMTSGDAARAVRLYVAVCGFGWKLL